MNIQWVPASALKPSEWEVTYALKPDRKMLEDSMRDAGWLAPIVARSNGEIIDGHERWDIAASNPKVYGKEVPVLWVDCDLADAIILHIRLNRGRGEVIPHRLSQALKKLRRTRKYSEEEIRQILNMTWDEADILFDGTLIKKRKIKDHVYSRAWVPVETQAEGHPVQIERPPNKDK